MICVLSLCLLLCIAGCASKQLQVIEKKGEIKTDECAMKDEICKEALDFQGEYDKMTEEQQKDMVAVLNSYIENCDEAKKGCENSKQK